MPKPVVYLGMPRRDSMMPARVAESFYLWPTKNCKALRASVESSLLCQAFNMHWAAARDPQFQYFAMIHSDVVAEEWWLDTLLDELREHEADIVSAVIPIKSDEGLTSTAVATDDPWTQRRLTMHEVFDLPETFGSEHVGGPLLANTGLWVCDLSKPWTKRLNFETRDRIIWREDRWKVQCIPEDWYLSQRVHEQGGRILATRKVVVDHLGAGRVYSNRRPWGLKKTDLAEVA